MKFCLYLNLYCIECETRCHNKPLLNLDIQISCPDSASNENGLILLSLMGLQTAHVILSYFEEAE